MKFRNDDYPGRSKGNGELTDTIESEHPKRFVAVAEEQIRAMHGHNDGSAVELHQVGSREFIQHSIASSLEGKIGGSSNDDFLQQHDLFSEKGQSKNFAAAKIEYEKKSSQSQPTQLYGSQHDLLGKGQSKTETAMVGCNCGAEWTVTGQSTKTQGAEGGPGGIKIEQYGTAAGKGAAGYSTSGGGGPGEYRTGGGQREGYKG